MVQSLISSTVFFIESSFNCFMTVCLAQEQERVITNREKWVEKKQGLDFLRPQRTIKRIRCPYYLFLLFLKVSMCPSLCLSLLSL